MKLRLCSVALAVLFLFTYINAGTNGVSAAQTVTPYEWNNVAYGGGGYVTGIVFHPAEPNLIYIRTDIGGAYRWEDEQQRWIPLNDIFSRADENLYGIDGIAVDPQNPDTVYIAAGKYPYNSPCDVLKSTDRGKSWTRMNLNKRFNANGVAERKYGECIAVNPQNSNEIYAGTRNDGLWRYFNGEWTRVSGIESGTAPLPIRAVVFGGGEIYVSVIGAGVYRGSGSTWNLLPGSPETVKSMTFASNGVLYISSSTGIYKYQDLNSAPTDISPVKGKDYSSVAVGIDAPNTVVTAGNTGSSYMKYPVYRSTNGGESWVDTTSPMTRTNTVPWWRNEYFSSNTADIALNPYNSNEIWITDWFGVWKTSNANGSRPIWTNPVKGIEEMCPFDGISTPTGARLLSAVADNDGARHDDISVYPEKTFGSPRLKTTFSLDFCEDDANFTARVGIDHNDYGNGAYSTDNGQNWTPFESYPTNASGNKLGAGRIAVSAKKNHATGNPTLVSIPINGSAVVSTDLGCTWQDTAGLPDNIVTGIWSRTMPIASDRVNENKFYVYTNNRIYTSTDNGFNWTQGDQTITSNTTGGRPAIIKTAPGIEGEVWVSAGVNGLYRSIDSGLTANKLSNVSSVVTFGFGKEAPGKTNPTVFLYGTVNGVESIYRSIDMGETWVCIVGDEQQAAGNSPNFMEGDRQHFGVVYIGTDGRGIFSGTPIEQTPQQPFPVTRNIYPISDISVGNDIDPNHLSQELITGRSEIGKYPSLPNQEAKRYILMKFDLRDLEGTVDSANLYGYIKNWVGGNAKGHIYAANDNWDEQSVTFGTMPVFTETNMIEQTWPYRGAYTLEHLGDLTEYIRTEQKKDGVASIVIYMPTLKSAGTVDSLYINSKEHPTNKPYLELVMVRDKLTVHAPSFFIGNRDITYTGLEAGTLTVNMRIENFAPVSENAVMALGLYNGDSLENTAVSAHCEINGPLGDQTLTADINVTTASENHILRVFIWKSLEYMEPLDGYTPIAFKKLPVKQMIE